MYFISNIKLALGIFLIGLFNKPGKSLQCWDSSDNSILPTTKYCLGSCMNITSMINNGFSMDCWPNKTEEKCINFYNNLNITTCYCNSYLCNSSISHYSTSLMLIPLISNLSILVTEIFQTCIFSFYSVG